MEKNNFLKSFEKKQKEFLELFMEKIEHPEVAVLFERFRDYIDDMEQWVKQIEKKEKENNFI
jgi:hypothetical protein